MSQENFLATCKTSLDDIAKTCAPNIDISDLKVLVKIVENQNYALRMAFQAVALGADDGGLSHETCAEIRDALQSALDGENE